MKRPMSIELVNPYGTHTVRIAIEEAAVLLEAADVDAVIEHLSLIRASMTPELSKEPSRTHQYVIELDPCWHSEIHPMYDGAVVFLRHSGLGWAGFALPTQSLEKLHDALSQHLEKLADTHSLPN